MHIPTLVVLGLIEFFLLTVFFSRYLPKVDYLQREQDRIAGEIVHLLDKLSLDAQDEIINIVINKVYLGTRHIQRNPMRY